MKAIYIIYIIQVFAVITFVCSVQFRKKKNILLCQTAASILYTISYLAVGGYSGAVTEIFEQIKDITFYIFEKKDKKIPLIYLIVFCAGVIAVSVLTFDGIASLAPLCINIAYFVSSYFKNPKHIRWTVFICGFVWMYYNFSLGAYIFCVGNLFEIISGGISILRFKNENNKTKRNRRKKVKVH